MNNLFTIISHMKHLSSFHTTVEQESDSNACIGRNIPPPVRQLSDT